MEPVDGDAPSGHADVEVLEEAARWVVAMRGEFDLVTAEVLESAVATLVGSRPIVLDMSEVTFIDSSGLKPLIRAHARGASIAVRSASPAVEAVFSLTGLGDVFPAER